MERSGKLVRPEVLPSTTGCSNMVSVETRDKRDFDGKVDCEKGVVGDVRAALKLASLVPLANVVARVGRALSRLVSCGAVWC